MAKVAARRSSCQRPVNVSARPVDAKRRAMTVFGSTVNEDQRPRSARMRDISAWYRSTLRILTLS